MGKKYLDTKQNTIEAAVLDVWVDAAEEQKAIHDAAKMIVGGAEIGEATQEHPMVKARRLAKEAEDEKKKKDEKTGAGRSSPGIAQAAAALAAVASKAEKDFAAAQAADTVGAQASQVAPVNTGYPKIGAEELPRKKAKETDAYFKTTAVPPVGSPTVDIGPLKPPKQAEPKKTEKPKKKAKKWVDPDTQVQKGHPDYKKNPDGTYGPRHKWSRGKYAGSDDPRFSSDPMAGRGDLQYQHYQHELEVQEAIRDAAYRMISEIEQDDPRQTGASVGDPGRGGTSVAMQKQRKREKEQKELQRQAKVGKGVNAPGELTPAARRGERGSRRVQAYQLPDKPTGEPVERQGAAPKAPSKKYADRRIPHTTKAAADSPAAKYGGGPEVGLQKKPTKPRTGIKPPSQ